MPPITAHTSNTPSGEASVRMMVPGVRKIPTAMTWPITRAVAAATFSSRASFAPTSEHRSHRELEGAWPAGPEHTARGVDRLTEARGAEVARGPRLCAVAHQHVGVSRVVLHAHAQDVRDVEQVEHFHHRLDPHAAPRKRPRHTKVQR